MICMLSGIGKVLTAEDALRLAGYEPHPDECGPVSAVIVADSPAAALAAGYDKYGDGHWLADGNYIYFSAPPAVAEAAPDQYLKSLPATVAPTLPGFEAVREPDSIKPQLPPGVR